MRRKRESKISHDADGNECVGDECIRLVMPKDSNEVRIDLTECEPDVQRKIAQRISKGGGADFKVRPGNEDESQD